jgi:hypothetical protein
MLLKGYVLMLPLAATREPALAPLRQAVVVRSFVLLALRDKSLVHERIEVRV